MLSTSKCRDLLGQAGHGLDDADVERLRDQLQSLAEVVVMRATLVLNGRARREVWCHVPPARLAEVHERSAIMEYEGGLDRDEAERRAIGALCEQVNGASACK